MKLVPEWLRYLIWGPVYSWTPAPYRPVVCYRNIPDSKREFEIGCGLLVQARGTHATAYMPKRHVSANEFDQIVDQQPAAEPVSRKPYKPNEIYDDQ